MAKYLFLDFDGVMHPLGAPVDRLFCHQELLSSWLLARSDVLVVVSSNWRQKHPLDEMREFVSEDPRVQERVVGFTPTLSQDEAALHGDELGPTRFERESEIRLWLARSIEPWASWAALDDQAWLFRPFCRQLVLCQSAVGLTPDRLGEVGRILG